MSTLQLKKRTTCTDCGKSVTEWVKVPGSFKLCIACNEYSNPIFEPKLRRCRNCNVLTTNYFHCPSCTSKASLGITEDLPAA